MILKFKAKNILVYENIEIDFLIHSRKTGKNIKNNDFVKIKDDLKVQKKLGLIGSNSSGKTSAIYLFKIFALFLNIGSLYNKIYGDCLIELERKILHSEYDRKPPLNFEELNIKVYEKQNELHSMIREKFEDYFLNISLDSNNKQIEFEIEFFYKNKIITGNYLINKNGIIKYFFECNGKSVFKDELSFYKLPNSVNTKLTYESWDLNILHIPFDSKFDFGIRDAWEFPVSTNNRNHFINIFDYVRHNGKENHFLNWIKIADYSINNLVSNIKNKIFSFQKENVIVNADNLSLGTRKWIILYYYIFIAIKKSDEISNLILYDEIENSFHSKLILCFLDIFDEKISNSQLLFTTHNPEVFDKSFRHDGIYLTEQNKNKCQISRLDKCKLRKDIVFPKFYLDEKIGYHPDDQTIINFYERE